MWKQWAIVAPLSICVTLALAELASAAPTSGGLYYWTYAFANPRWRGLLSWLVGCESCEPTYTAGPIY
jgi:amino acid transporter